MGAALTGESLPLTDSEPSEPDSCKASGQLERHLEVSPYLAEKKKQAEVLRLEILALSRRCREERAMWSQSGVHQIHWSSSGADLVADEELQAMELISREKTVVPSTSVCSPEDSSPGPRAQEDVPFGPFRPRLPAEEPWSCVEDPCDGQLQEPHRKVSI